jgi:hypothetical protein
VKRVVRKIKEYLKDRKIIEFHWCRYKDQFQVGISACLQNISKDIEYPEYNYCHFHIWIDLGFRCFEITILDKDYKE